MLGESDRSVAVGLECLRHVGIDLSARPTKAEALAEYERIWSTLGNRTIEDIADLPLMQDAEPSRRSTCSTYCRCRPNTPTRIYTRSTSAER